MISACNVAFPKNKENWRVRESQKKVMAAEREFWLVYVLYLCVSVCRMKKKVFSFGRENHPCGRERRGMVNKYPASAGCAFPLFLFVSEENVSQIRMTFFHLLP